MQALILCDQAESTSTGKFEMYIATNVKPGQKVSSAVRRMVPPPRGNGAAAMPKSTVIKQLSKQIAEPSAQHQAASVTQQTAAAQSRAVRAELASLATQLKSKNSQLSKADTALRSESYRMFFHTDLHADKAWPAACTVSEKHFWHCPDALSRLS